MMPDEIMRFKFGEAIFIGTRMHPIKATIVPISKYPIKYKMTTLSTIPRKYQIECFNLDEFRRKLNDKNKIELE